MFSSLLIISLILTFLGYTQQLLLNLLNLKMKVKDWKTKNVSNDEIKKTNFEFLPIPEASMTLLLHNCSKDTLAFSFKFFVSFLSKS